jgi:type IV pilus assembly protein PilB
MGMERFALGASLTGVLAQRLVRRICNDCRQEQALSETEGRWLRTAGLEAVPQKLWAGVGCDNCKGTGHRGRTALHELFAVDEETRAMLSDGTDLRDIERAAASKLQPMRYDAALKVVAGDTTAQEAMRVLAFMPKYE